MCRGHGPGPVGSPVPAPSGTAPQTCSWPRTPLVVPDPEWSCVQRLSRAAGARWHYVAAEPLRLLPLPCWGQVVGSPRSSQPGEMRGEQSRRGQQVAVAETGTCATAGSSHQPWLPSRALRVALPRQRRSGADKQGGCRGRADSGNCPSSCPSCPGTASLPQLPWHPEDPCQRLKPGPSSAPDTQTLLAAP